VNTRPAQPHHGAALPGTVAALDVRRVERALARRTRYRYVQPRVQAQAGAPGWVIVSPNCSRNVDPDGGVIDIAWFEPARGKPATWRLHRRDQAGARWMLVAEGLTLAQAAEQVCSDPLGVWWP
jgi:hypothetical protein